MSKASYFLLFILLPILLFISGCSNALVDAPSLNKRPFEISLEEMRSQAGDKVENKNNIADAIAIERASIAALLPNIDAQMRDLYKQHENADSDFTVQANIAQSVVNRARGAAFGSDIWSEAQIAISRLDRARSPSLTSLNEIDEKIFALLDNALNDNIARDQSDAAQLTSLIQIQEYVVSDVTGQTQIIDNLANRLAKK